MNRIVFAILLIAAYFGFKYWRLQNRLEEEKRKNKLNNQKNPFQKINWDAQDIDYEEVKEDKK